VYIQIQLNIVSESRIQQTILVLLSNLREPGPICFSGKKYPSANSANSALKYKVISILVIRFLECSMQIRGDDVF
jgi:hypothetical protein